MIDYCSYAHNTSNCQIKDLSYIHLHLLTSKSILRTHSDKHPDGLIAQLAEHCTGIAEVIRIFTPEILFWL